MDAYSQGIMCSSHVNWWIYLVHNVWLFESTFLKLCNARELSFNI